MARLIKGKDGDMYVKDVRLVDSPEKLKGIFNEIRWEILKLLAERPRYPAEMAKELGLHEQKVYYHVRKLKESGLVEMVDKSERGGALAKYFKVRDHAFAFELPFGDKKLADFPIQEDSETTRKFLYPFIQNGELRSKIVVGSPDPHGPHQTRAKDGHYANDVALFFGQYCAVPGSFSTKLDVDVVAENYFDTNIISVGGPLTNVVTNKLNKYLPVKFESEDFPFRKLISKKTGKEYTNDSVGLLAKIVNPEHKEKRVLIVAGVRYIGTKSSVLALTRHTEKVLEDYEGEDNWARVVEGKDMDGDGKIDDVEILE